MPWNQGVVCSILLSTYKLSAYYTGSIIILHTSSNKVYPDQSKEGRLLSYARSFFSKYKI
jgi:hypothetical protein